MDTSGIRIGDTVSFTLFVEGFVVTQVEGAADFTGYNHRGEETRLDIRTSDKLSLYAIRKVEITELENEFEDYDFVGTDENGDSWDLKASDIIDHKPKVYAKPIQKDDHVVFVDDNKVPKTVYAVKSCQNGKAWVNHGDYDFVVEANRLRVHAP